MSQPLHTRENALVALACLKKLKGGVLGDVMSVDEIDALVELSTEEPKSDRSLAEVLCGGRR